MLELVLEERVMFGMECVARSGPGLSNTIWSTPSSLTIFSFQLLTVSHNLASGGGSGGQTPSFSI